MSGLQNKNAYWLAALVIVAIAAYALGSLGSRSSAAPRAQDSLEADYAGAKVCFQSTSEDLRNISDRLDLVGSGSNYEELASVVSDVKGIADGGTLTAVPDGNGGYLNCPST